MIIVLALYDTLCARRINFPPYYIARRHPIQMDPRYFNGNFMSTDASPWDPSTPWAHHHISKDHAYAPLNPFQAVQQGARTLDTPAPYFRQAYQFPFQVPGYLMKAWTSATAQAVSMPTRRWSSIPSNRAFVSRPMAYHPQRYHNRNLMYSFT